MKKILSVILAITILMTTFMSTTAFAVLETESARETKIYFEAPEEWGTVKNAYCHLYSVYGGKEIKQFAFQSKKEKCEFVDAESNLFSFDTAKYCLDDDTSGYAIEDNADYGVLFSAINTEGRAFYACNLTLGSACIGDTVYVTGTDPILSPEDGNPSYLAKWKNNSDKYGYMADILSTGEIKGEYFPVYQPIEEIVAEWLGSWAVLNEKIITTDIVKNICTETKADPQRVYDTYSVIFSKQLANNENTPFIASLERIGVLVGLENPVYVVAGSKELCKEFWNGVATEVPYNVMGKVGDVYKKTFMNVQPCNNLQIKVVEDSYGKYPNNWYGCAGGNNVTFNVFQKCDVTVTYNPTTELVTVSGDGVEVLPDFEINYISVAGNGTGNWLNGAEWKLEGNSNVMTEIEENLYRITYEDVEAGENYQFKFAVDGSWSNHWSGTFESFGTETNAVYNNSGDNILFSLTEKSNVTITLDLREFDFVSKQGAKFKIDINTLGDVNNDGTINITDATEIMKYSAELIGENEINLKYADVNDDGIVNVIDATAIQKILAGI